MNTNALLRSLTLAAILPPILGMAADAAPLKTRLASVPFRIAYESYVNDNWEIYVMNADGSNPVNLTRTPNEHEHYPQVSPDGTRICFSLDTGEGRETVRSLWYMDIDGRNRKKVADQAREPFWRADGQVIGFLPQEFPRFNVIDYSTKGMSFYDLATGKITPHPNSGKLHHLYNPSFAPNGKWIAATVHAGMGFSHAILLIEARGDKIINLGIPGCRPCLSPDGKSIAWGAEDFELCTAPIDLDSDDPKVGPRFVEIHDKKNKIYHIDWSPDGKFLSFSRGPDGKGDLSKRGTFQSACEIVGVYANDWNLYAVSAERAGIINMETAGPGEVAVLTTNGASNKESSWFPAGKKAKE